MPTERHRLRKHFPLISSLILSSFVCGFIARAEERTFRAGAASIDITPVNLPVIVNGGFFEQSVKTVTDRLYAKAIVLDDGRTKLAIVVGDSCMFPRELLDEVKALASKQTGIPLDHILISATHTHSAPSSMGALGSRVDPAYPAFVAPRIARSIQQAYRDLQPARIGWTVVQDSEHTHCRRWIFRSDKVQTDPFGDRTMRANMHPGFQNADAIAPSGPVDPGLSLIAVQTRGGEPLAVLANYSMHYFGAEPLSADYFGRFRDQFEQLAMRGKRRPMVVLSQGTSGDQMWMDYGRPRPKITLDDYSRALAENAFAGYQNVRYHDWVPLAMAEQKLTLKRRTPDAKRLEWARKISARLGAKLPSTYAEVYAKEAIYLHEQPQRELKIQAIRIGELGITGLPNEVFAITGLKLKAQSPLQPTFNIELANGGEGYIPPPEQHKLGGYTTWPARTAALEVQAEPRIAETALKLLEQVAGQPRRPLTYSPTRYAAAVLKSQPLVYWPLEELAGDTCLDASGNHRDGQREDLIALYLDGPVTAGLQTDKINRCVHLAGGRIKAVAPLKHDYTIELWFWNGYPINARPITGYLFALGDSETAEAAGLTGGTEGGKLFAVSSSKKAVGAQSIAAKTWHHLAIVRNDREMRIYLDGAAAPEVTLRAKSMPATQVLIGGDAKRTANFEGRIDDVSIFNRALNAAEIAQHMAAAQYPTEVSSTGAGDE